VRAVQLGLAIGPPIAAADVDRSPIRNKITPSVPGLGITGLTRSAIVPSFSVFVSRSSEVSVWRLSDRRRWPQGLADTWLELWPRSGRARFFSNALDRRKSLRLKHAPYWNRTNNPVIKSHAVAWCTRCVRLRFKIGSRSELQMESF
jgi:hypothetical protein